MGGAHSKIAVRKAKSSTPGGFARGLFAVIIVAGVVAVLAVKYLGH